MNRNERYKVIAYLLIVIVAAFGAVRAESASHRATVAASKAAIAQNQARAVDRKGDYSLCKAENRIRIKTNKRDAALEDTAVLVKESLLVISKADRIATNANTNSKLRAIADRAQKIRTDFPTEKLSNCEKRFPQLGK